MTAYLLFPVNLVRTIAAVVYWILKALIAGDQDAR